MTPRSWPTAPLLLLALVGCGGSSSDEAAYQTAAEDKEMEEDGDLWMGSGGMPAEPAPAAPPSPRAARAASAPEPSERARGRRAEKMFFGSGAPDDGAILEEDGRGEAEGEGKGEPARTRAWFPETFLWQPHLQTDAQGKTEVAVTVPDRLTEWRVLALAHSRQGGLAGDTTSFTSTLPISADPLVPPFLLQGDRARVPVQVVNTTSEPRTTTLDIAATGATTVRTTGRVSLSPGGSEVVWTDVPTPRAGEVTLRVELAGADAVERTFSVLPAGRPVTLSRGGTLAASRSVELMGPLGLDPQTARVRLAVYPGALGVLRQELAFAGDRGGLGGTAYALSLAGQAPGVLEALGQPVSAEGTDPVARAIAERLRTLRIRATSRAAQLTRSPELLSAIALVGPALQHPDDPLLSNLGSRLTGQLAQMQRPDGTFGGQDGQPWTAQRLLATTAAAVSALHDAAAAPGAPEDRAQRQKLADRAALRASAAVERSAALITEPYTAALVLQAGLASGALEEQLHQLVVDAVEEQPDGSRRLPVADQVQRPDGSAPTALEATALAALALQGRGEDALVADLGAAVLAGWRPAAGWGDGRTDALALQAVVALFAEPLPDAVTVTLSRDGAPLAERVLDASALRDLAVIDLPAGDAEGLHTWGVSAEPAVPGLGFELALQAWVPWPEASAQTGLELDVAVPPDLRLGQRADLVVTAAAPAGRLLSLDQGLPAGVQVDEDALSRLVRDGTLMSFEVEDGRMRLTLSPLESARPARLVVPITPTLPGRLHAGASTLSVKGRDDLAVTVPPEAWVIGG